VAVFCSHCGEELPREDTRFCSSCGALRTARVMNPSSTAGADKISSSENALAVPNQMEQAAPMPPLHMNNQHTGGEGFPSWMSKLQHDSRNQQPLKEKSQQVVAPHQQEIKSPDVLARSSEPEPPGQQAGPVIRSASVERSVQQDFSYPLPPPQPFSSMRELRVKIWNETNPAQGEAVSQEGDPLQKDPISNVADKGSGIGGTAVREKHPIEDVPTQSIESVSATPPQTNIPIDTIPTSLLPVVPERQVQASGQPQLSLHGLPSYQQDMHSQQKPEKALEAATDIAKMSTMQLHVQGRNQIAPLPETPRPVVSDPAPVLEAPRPTMSGGPAPVPETPRPAASRDAVTSMFRGGKGRLPLLVGGAAIVLLLFLALGSWIIAFQPFSVSHITNVQQSYSDTKLGVSLRYPGVWKTPQVDYNKKTLTLTDVSNTNQMNISVVDATTGSQESYTQQQVAKLGINNPKPGSAITFAGVTWQQIQGDMQVKGAEYTSVLFTTVYKNHFYTLTQMSLRNTYSDEEKLVFAPTRQSLRFL